MMAADDLLSFDLTQVLANIQSFDAILQTDGAQSNRVEANSAVSAKERFTVGDDSLLHHGKVDGRLCEKDLARDQAALSAEASALVRQVQQDQQVLLSSAVQDKQDAASVSETLLHNFSAISSSSTPKHAEQSEKESTSLDRTAQTDEAFWQALRSSSHSNITRETALERTRDPESPNGWHLSLRLAQKGLRPRDAEKIAVWLQQPGGKPDTVDAVELPNNALGAAGLRHLAGVLADPACGRLATLDLSGNEVCLMSATHALRDTAQKSFTLAGLHMLADNLPHCALTDLNLSHNELSPVGARVVAQALTAPGLPLRRLSLAATQLADEGCSAVAAVLPRAHGLTSLDLSHNISPEDGDTGSWVPLLAAALPRCRTLRILGLANNRLGHARVKLSSAELSGPTVGATRELAVANETVDGMAIIAAALPKSPLTALDVRDNSLSILAVQALARSLVSANLQTLDLSSTAPAGSSSTSLGPGNPANHDRSTVAANAIDDDGAGDTACDNAANQQQVYERWRLYRGSAIGVGLQLLNSLAVAEAVGSGNATLQKESTPMPPLHYVCQMGWTEWCGALLELRPDDLYALDSATGRSVLEVASPACAEMVSQAMLQHEQDPEPIITYRGGLEMKSYDPFNGQAVDKISMIVADRPDKIRQTRGEVVMAELRAELVETVKAELTRTEHTLHDLVAELRQDIALVNESLLVGQSKAQQLQQQNNRGGPPASNTIVNMKTESAAEIFASPNQFGYAGGVGIDALASPRVRTVGTPVQLKPLLENDSLDQSTIIAPGQGGGTNVVDPGTPIGEGTWDALSWLKKAPDDEGVIGANSGSTHTFQLASANGQVETGAGVGPVEHIGKINESKSRGSRLGVDPEGGPLPAAVLEEKLRNLTAANKDAQTSLRKLSMKVDSAIIAGSVPEELAHTVAEIVHGQESVLRLLMLQGEAQTARLALPGEAVIVPRDAEGRATAASIARAVKRLDDGLKKMHDELTTTRDEARDARLGCWGRRERRKAREVWRKPKDSNNQNKSTTIWCCGARTRSFMPNAAGRRRQQPQQRQKSASKYQSRDTTNNSQFALMNEPEVESSLDSAPAPSPPIVNAPPPKMLSQRQEVSLPGSTAEP